MTKYLSFQEFGQESELTQVAEGKIIKNRC